MKVLVVGNGGREHAVCWKLRQSSKVSELYCAPGNPGTAKIARNLPVKVEDIPALLEFAISEKIDLTVVGPEVPLSLGIVDAFQQNNLRIFGPRRSAAMLETSKSFAKEVMQSVGVPTANCEVFENLESARSYLEKHGVPVVLKVDGLAAGKGVFVCQEISHAQESLNQVFNEFKADRVLIEDFLIGKEVSYIIATDGEQIVPMASSHDYKRIGEDDKGPNTGGMGTVSPTPNLIADNEKRIVSEIMQPVINEMKKRGAPFCGFLYAGLMIAPDGKINVLEFNTRLGDPETQVIMRRMQSDLFETLYGLAGKGSGETVPQQHWAKESAVCVVLASAGYPESASSGDEIFGIELTENIADVVVFHAGTEDKNGRIFTKGGRILNVTALGSNIEDARSKAYRACDLIQFRGMQFRRDIAKIK